jgi:hypothetical protein
MVITGDQHPRKNAVDPIILEVGYVAVELNDDGSYKTDAKGYFVTIEGDPVKYARVTIDLEQLGGFSSHRLEKTEGE